MRHGIAISVMAAACGSSGPSGKMDRERAAALFTEVVIETAPGLSGLAVDDTGGIWTETERDQRVYRITLVGTTPMIETFVVKNAPPGSDLEAIAWLAPGKLAFGTEGQEHDGATIALADVRGHDIVITGKIELPDDKVGLHVLPNKGAEGLCGMGDTLVVAIETVQVERGRRWAPVVRIDHGKITSAHKLWLTSETGKLSSLDCRWGPKHEIEAIAIERHFQVTKILTFTVPASGEITPHEALDLGPVLNNALNLEGIAWTKDGGVIAVNDNQYTTITGPSELVLFKPGVLR